MYVCCISQSSIKTPFKWDWWFWCQFVPNLSPYMCTNKYSNKGRYDKVIAKTKWCSFLCLTVYMKTGSSHKFSLSSVIHRKFWTINVLCWQRSCKSIWWKLSDDSWRANCASTTIWRPLVMRQQRTTMHASTEQIRKSGPLQTAVGYFAHSSFMLRNDYKPYGIIWITVQRYKMYGPDGG